MFVNTGQKKLKKNSFEIIYTDNVSQLKKVYNQFDVNYKRRENYQSEQVKNKDKATHVTNLFDPLFSNVEYSNGNKH